MVVSAANVTALLEAQRSRAIAAIGRGLNLEHAAGYRNAAGEVFAGRPGLPTVPKLSDSLTMAAAKGLLMVIVLPLIPVMIEPVVNQCP